MKWINLEDQKPPTGEQVLVLKSYMDAEFDFEKGGYHPDKNFWTRPRIGIDICWSQNQWNAGGKATHWMHLPELPNAV